MNLLPTAEQEAIGAAAADFLDKEFTLRDLTEVAPAAPVIDRATWRRVGELGWLGLGLAADAGGVGATLAEEMLVFRELGRHLTPGPFLSCVLGAHAASAAGDAEVAHAIAAGDVVVGLAEHGRLTDALDAELLVLVTPGAVSLIEAGDVTDRQLVRGFDPLVRIEEATLPEPIARTTEAIRWRGVVLVAAMQVGIADRTRDLSAGHASTREQFGKPIGSFQAVKHRCADQATRAEVALAQTLLAAGAVREGARDASLQAAAAKAIATDAAIRNSADNIQNHGAMGFAAESGAHLYVKRAHMLEQTLGSSRQMLAHLLPTLDAD